MRNNLNILVVGGAGYIGSHTTLSLKAAGYNVVVYDNFLTGHLDACFGDHLVEGELINKRLLIKTIEKFEIDCVIQFAALIEAGQSVIEPIPFYQNNVAGTISLLEAMHATKVKRLVFSSTAAVYGNSNSSELLHEDKPKSPINPYGESKAIVETMLESCVNAYGMQAIALRYFNAAGADAKGRSGERHEPETHLIPLVIETARGVRPHINIYGTDYDTPDGTCIRDYVHVSDLASGHVQAVKRLFEIDHPYFDPINLGSGYGYSVKEIIESVKKISKQEFKICESKRRHGDPAVLVADASKAKKMLGWQAQFSNIDQIVRDAWNFANK
jgi:UDP-glucose-4-epimerase GalE